MRRFGSTLLAASILFASSACASSGLSDDAACAKINLTIVQMNLVLSNPSPNRDALRTGVRGVVSLVEEIESLEFANAEFQSATKVFTTSLNVLMAGFNSAIDGKRTASSLEPNIVDFQIAAAGLLPYCDLD
jgi:hypothetical protein